MSVFSGRNRPTAQRINRELKDCASSSSCCSLRSWSVSSGYGPSASAETSALVQPLPLKSSACEVSVMQDFFQQHLVAVVVLIALAIALTVLVFRKRLFER